MADLKPVADAIIAHYYDATVVTHAAECWRWHSNCAVDRLAAYIADLEHQLAARDMQGADR